MIQTNIVLLCAQHHREKTSGLLPLAAVVAAHKSPLNLRTGASHPYDLSYSGTRCEATIGSNLHVWPSLSDGDFTVPLLVDDTPIVLFRAEDSRLLLTVQLFNDQNELLVQILDNQLVYSAAPWDVEFVGRQLTVRGGPGDIFVRMSFDPPAHVVIDRGRIWRNGVELDIAPEHLMVVNNHNSMSGCSTINCMFGVGIGNLPPGLSGASRSSRGRTMRLGLLVTGQPFVVSKTLQKRSQNHGRSVRPRPTVAARGAGNRPLMIVVSRPRREGRDSRPYARSQPCRRR